MNLIEANFSALARQYGAYYRTIKRAFEEKNTPPTTVQKKKRPSLLDPYREIIKEKLNLNCSAMSIFKFIEKQGFKGKYTIVRQYCASIKKDKTKKATIRVEHTPGLSAQVD